MEVRPRESLRIQFCYLLHHSALRDHHRPFLLNCTKISCLCTVDVIIISTLFYEMNCSNQPTIDSLSESDSDQTLRHRVKVAAARPGLTARKKAGRSSDRRPRASEQHRRPSPHLGRGPGPAAPNLPVKA